MRACSIGVAVRQVAKQDVYTPVAEESMTLAGFAAFFDPPKQGILAVIEELKRNGVSKLRFAASRSGSITGERSAQRLADENLSL